MHTLGLFHEHQRPDRDTYIDVDMIAVNKTGLFNQLQKAGFLEGGIQALNKSLKSKTSKVQIRFKFDRL